MVFQAEGKGVAYPPLSSGVTEAVRLPLRPCAVVFRFRTTESSVAKKCFYLWGHDGKISLLLLRLGFVFRNISLLSIGCICLLLLNMAAPFRLYPMISGIQFFIPLVSIRIHLKVVTFFLWLSLKLDVCWLYLI